MAWSEIVEPVSDLERLSQETLGFSPGRFRMVPFSNAMGQPARYRDTLTGDVYTTHYADHGPASHGRRHGVPTFSEGPFKGLGVPGVAPVKLGKKKWVSKILEPALGMAMGGLIGFEIGQVSANLMRAGIWNLAAGNQAAWFGVAQIGASIALPAVGTWATSYLPGGTASAWVFGYGATLGLYYSHGQAALTLGRRFGDAINNSALGRAATKVGSYVDPGDHGLLQWVFPDVYRNVPGSAYGPALNK